MAEAEIIIGGSYGDEGKGLAANWRAERRPGSCLNVLYNGGPQRGHTVEARDGRRHVFHHFGSGTFAGAVTCLDSGFMVNPAEFCREYDELKAINARPETCLVSAACRLTTVWDMIINQLAELSRGDARHGSCGMGIDETRVRCESMPAPSWGEAIRLTKSGFEMFCAEIRDKWLPERLRQLGITEIPEDWRGIIYSDGLIESSWNDLERMKTLTRAFDSFKSACKGYELILFEAGQGLMLSADSGGDERYLTPSATTSLEAAARISQLEGISAARVFYITRSYLTRHGAGPLPGECPAESIAEGLYDPTNVPNPFQQSLRYARLDVDAFHSRTLEDLAASRSVCPQLKSAVVTTWLDKTGGEIVGNGTLSRLESAYDEAYRSFSPLGDVK